MNKQISVIIVDDEAILDSGKPMGGRNRTLLLFLSRLT